MTPTEIGFAVAGIAVTLVTFWLGYRRLIGSKQERVRAANDAIPTMLIKRMLLENMTPTYDDLVRLIAGKAHENSVNVTELRAGPDVVPVLWAELLENDLIPGESRKDMLQAIASLEQSAKEVAALQSPVSATSAQPGRQRKQYEWTILLAAVAAVLGIAVAAIPQGGDAFGPPELVAIFGVAVGVLSVPAIARQSRSGGGSSGIFLPPDIYQNYPHERGGMDAFTTLATLSPFAAAALGRYTQDEANSANRGSPAGLFVRPRGTPWHRELVGRGLLQHGKPPEARKPSQEFLILTDDGRSVGRLLTAGEPVPQWLRAALSPWTPDSQASDGNGPPAASEESSTPEH